MGAQEADESVGRADRGARGDVTGPPGGEDRAGAGEGTGARDTGGGGAGGPGGEGPGGAPDDALLRAVERLAGLMAESGLPRMPARVLAYLLVEPVDGASAGELASRLRVSPAAISTAVRYLVQARLLVREREPGARRDTYRLHRDIWYETYRQRIEMLKAWEDLLGETIELVGPANAGTSLRETHAFLAFIRREYPVLLEKWRERRDELLGEGPRRGDP